MGQSTCCELDCNEPVRCKQRCTKHYNKWRYSPQNPNAKQCTRLDCVELAKSRGMCQEHYNSWYNAEGRKQGSKRRRCAVEGCERPFHSSDYCNFHYYRHRRGLPMDAERLRIKTAPDERTCHISGCDKPLEAQRMCDMHYQRFRKHGDPFNTFGRARGKDNLCEVELCPERPLDQGFCRHHDLLYLEGKPLGGYRYARRRLSDEGYVWTRLFPDDPMWRAGGYIPEHRVIMARALGRRLEGDENVHHLNGDRADNRPENLELWVKSQPCGQRPQDLVSWARQIIERYGDYADPLAA